jgi:hypothetical protein
MAFYATIDADSVRSDMPTVPYLLPASSWARYNTRSVRLPRRLRHVGADGGGFVATRIWGDYRYSPQQYVSWLHTFRPESAAAVAYCCEDEIGDNGLGNIDVLLDHHHRRTRIGNGVHLLPHHVGVDGREAGGRLVEQENFGIEHQRTGHREHVALAAAQVAGFLALGGFEIGARGACNFPQGNGS